MRVSGWVSESKWYDSGRVYDALFMCDHTGEVYHVTVM